ncbi:bifunctional 4-hydroxy-2-oxoglutarate aldolase/2-dehydro-3-deoxy-phosphogluconate aldolase [Marinobacter oulmenensis]|uniref:2-dehydro-3-deoxy-phosphogluconate aldolase n=1 Tax=Marinobacter oulmenensis TaxID=643747 RepID=A0A840UJC1_9GAMM|nr:bifunctional 4-hydroxy-2-oxoglutarate aldolase/2-dehydro-3-deoxy-phosphogluconate aldolase [Marinobacter oulmenensis]MBB5322405.1 2-dehydro-3-deoxyphosphogluconate aldolase/(4S)-4-hydroxy-2-oxoglutarate aldolase [Marinobacter oulmenensis]
MSHVSAGYRQRVAAVLAASPLIPVLAIRRLEDAVPLCQALYDGGVRVLEITLRTEHGEQAITRVQEAIPDAIVGAGTVTTAEQFRRVTELGAAFVITPGLTGSILNAAVESDTPLLPGVATASELMLGYEKGLRHFKFFPAEVAGGIPALRALAGPFPDVTFCPTGGIRRETAADYLALANVASVGGSWLTPDDLVQQGDWEAISGLARTSLASLGATRNR